MQEEQLSLVFGALADSTRRAILAHLAEGEKTVNELAEPFDISVQAISKHLKVLEKAGLISRSRTAQWRPCKLETAPLTEANTWIERYKQQWSEQFHQLEREITRLQAEQRGQNNE